jgi:hypothetical protein
MIRGIPKYHMEVLPLQDKNVQVYSGGRDWEDHGLKPAEEKVSKTPFQSISQAWWCTPVIPDTQEAVGRRITFRGWNQDWLKW